MRIDQALDRLHFRLAGSENSKPTWKANDKDVEMYNTIKEFTERKQKEQLSENSLFAKMYILSYMRILEKYRGDVYSSFARQTLIQFLENPISGIIEKFVTFLNDSEYDNLMKELEIEVKHPAMESEEDKQANLNKINEAIKDEYNYKRFHRQVWDYETAQPCLMAEVNAAIEILNKNI